MFSFLLPLCFALPAAQIDGGFTIKGFDDSGLGTAVSWLDDINGDGVPEVLASTDYLAYGPGFDQGVILVFSGADGTLLRSDYGLAGTYVGNTITTFSDLDGDGVSEYGSRGAGTDTNDVAFTVFSGATGHILWTLVDRVENEFYNLAAAEIDDLDFDGVPDLIVRGDSPDDGQGGTFWNAGHAVILSGVNGTILREHRGTYQGQAYAESVADAGDLNLDGIGDYILGNVNYTQTWNMEVFSGADGSLLWTATSAPHKYGYQVGHIGDVNGDGLPDYLSTYNGSQCFSGADGSELWSDPLSRPYIYNWSAFKLLGDLNHDGLQDFGVADSVIGGPGYIDIISGANGEFLDILSRRTVGGAADRYGRDFAAAPDMNQDGFKDLIVGRPYYRNDYVFYDRSFFYGEVFVHHYRPMLKVSHTEWSASGGSTLELQMDLPSQSAGQSYRILTSTTGRFRIAINHHLYAPLGGSSLVYHMQQGWVPAYTTDFQGTLDSQGDALAFVLPGAHLNSVIGTTLHFSAVAFDGAQVRMTTNAVHVTIVP